MKNFIPVASAGLAAVSAWIAYNNSNIGTTNISVKSKKLPSAFIGYKIAHISDLHNTVFGKNNKRLFRALTQTNADIIVITGDVIDSRRTNLDTAISFAKEAVKIAPTYYVPGNHESRIPEYADLKREFLQCGITILENNSIDLYRQNECITLCGIYDPCFYLDSENDEKLPVIREKLASAIPQNNSYKILLVHRPEYFKEYIGKANLVFCGHAHGGQFRIPFIGGLNAPGQGFFPDYTEGIHTFGDTSMIISRGLGNSLFPFRLNNNPEIIIAELLR